MATASATQAKYPQGSLVQVLQCRADGFVGDFFVSGTTQDGSDLKLTRAGRTLADRRSALEAALAGEWDVIMNPCRICKTKGSLEMNTAEFLDDYTARHRGETLTYSLPDGRAVQLARDAVKGEMVLDYQLADGRIVKACRLR